MPFFLISIWKILFLIEIGFYNGVVMKGLVLNFKLYLVIFLNGACLSSILFMESKNFECEADWEVV